VVSSPVCWLSTLQEGRGHGPWLRAGGLPSDSGLPAEGHDTFSWWKPSPSLHCPSRPGQRQETEPQADREPVWVENVLGGVWQG